MEGTPLAAVGALLAAAVGVIAWQAYRRPVLRRLAVRDALRRPGESALVVAGSLLGAAIITGSFIVGDTLESSIRTTSATQLGPVDEVIAVPDSADAAVVGNAIRAIDDERIDGVMSLALVRAPVAARGGGDTLAEPQAQVIEMDFAEGRSFGDDPMKTGVEGPTPGASQAALTAPLAETLQVQRGDLVSVYVYGSELELEVGTVLPNRGLAGFWLGFESTSKNLFVAPGTLEPVFAARKQHRGSVPPTHYVLVSNLGGVEEGAALTAEVTTLVREVLPDDQPLRIDQVKRDRLEHADADGKAFSELFLGIGSFAVLAGILLLVNIFVMLAEERKSQLGMLRAVGLRRADLVRVFMIEGALHSIVANALGALLGIGVGWAIVKLAAPIFGAFGDFSLTLELDAETSSVISGFFIGSLISLATIAATSARISRVNIIRAIRDLPEPRTYRARRRALIAGALLASLGGAWFVTAITSDDAWAAAILGPPMVLFGLLPLGSRLVARRAAVLGAAGGSLLWGIFGNAILGDRFFGSGEIFAFVLQGVLLTFSAVVLLSHSQEAIETVVRRLAARNLPLRLGLAYPLARRFRTGLTLGMFALVMFTMIFLAIMAAIFGGQVESFTSRAAGGFDIVASSAEGNPPTVEQIAAVDGVSDVAAMSFVTVLFQPRGYPLPKPWTATGIDANFVELGPPALEEDERAPGFASDAQVWDAVLSDPEAVVIPSFFLQAGGGPPAEVVAPGERFLMVDPITGESAPRRVVGVISEDVSFSGVLMSKESMRAVLGPRAVDSRFYVVADGSEKDARATATRLQGELLVYGVEAQTFRTIVEEFGRLNLQFLRLMQGYLALGLVVGIAGLGVVMARAVRDRRRQIGVLRSLGLLSRQVRSTFMLESGFIAVEGIGIGTILAIITASQLVATNSFGEGVEFAVPWGQVAFLTAAALAAALLATIWPARQAATIPPAVALRIAD